MSEPRTPSGTMQHLDEMSCLLYLEGQLERARAQEAAAHMRGCAACQTLLRALERESRLLTRAMFEEEPLPARLEEFQQRAARFMQWIWGAVFGLAATGAYAFYSGYIEPWQQQLEQAGFGGTNLLGLLIFQGAFWKGWQSMITLLEVVALLTLAGFGAALFRRRLRRGAAVALLLAGFCAALALPSTAGATEFRKGESVQVAKGETIKGDLFMSGARARIDGTVDGDVYVCGQSVDIYGHVTGDVIVFAQSVRINGQVDGNIRSVMNNLTISGSVNKNVTSFGESLTIDSSAKVGGSLTMFGGSVNLDGKLGRDLLYFGERINVNGTIDGEVRAKGGTLAIGDTAQIGGPVRWEGRSPAQVSAQAKLASPVEYHALEHKRRYARGAYFVWRVIWTAAFALFGLVLFVLMPKFARETVAAAENYGASFGLGVLVLFAVPIAAVIACVTVVGLLIGISTFLMWLLVLVCADLVVGAVVGQWLMGRTSEIWPLIGRMVVGLVVVRLVTTIPHIGGWAKLAVILWGMGAISLALYRKFQPVIAPGVPSAPSATPLPPNTAIGGTQPA